MTRKHVIAYTDGSALGNPGPGGYGTLLLHGTSKKELSGGFRRTTNNRMEITAAIEALKALKEPCRVTLYTDSKYLANAISKGWAERWQRNHWMRNKSEPALNPDLWATLLDLCKTHEVEFVWTRGHAGDAYNERCDRLAREAAARPNLPPDVGYDHAGS